MTRPRSAGEYDEIAHGLDRNSWDSRPTHLDEHEHPTNWTTDRAIDFLERRDPTRPFFLTVSYHRPHQPFDALPAYWQLYSERDLPSPTVGDWVEDLYGDKLPEYPDTAAWCADLPDWIVERARTGYCGSVTHVDHQINRILEHFSEMGERSNTLIVYTSDPGEMLGDHHLWRKTFAYEGSTRVPLVIRFPDEDDLVREPDGDWRPFYHGEHGPIYDDANACQGLVDEDTKYIWNPVTGDELLFDLDDDPDETRNLADDPVHRDTLERWRARMVDRLEGRAESFVEDGTLRSGTDRFE